MIEEYVNDEETDFYLTGKLSEKRINILDKILKVKDSNLRKYNNRIKEYAEQEGRDCVDIKLRDAQIKPMLMSLITERFFIGDKPGLGKTVMSAACYANYRYVMNKKGIKPDRVLVVTTSSHVKGFANEWESYGINLLTLTGGSLKIERKLRKEDPEDYDGIITNWDGLKTNGFLDYYLRNAEKYGYAVLDETSTLTNDKSITYRVVNNIINKYKKGIDRVIFLNGSSFEKNIFDFYYQFKILYPKLIPNKRFLEDNYVIRSGKPAHFLQIKGKSAQQRRVVKRYMGEIVDYKNQSELRERLKYFYMARDKSDYSSDLPKYNYILHPIEMTGRQRKLIKGNKNVTVLNSPTTTDRSLKLTTRTSPKLSKLIEHVEDVIEDRPLIYVYNKESQKTIKKELEKNNYRVDIINGDVGIEDKTQIIDEFNNYNKDILIFNVERALNIPTSDRILFYDIPTMPQRTNQIKGRIDRNNYDTPKFYDFFCYIDSPEMNNIIRLAYFREQHGNAFTGQEDYTYQELINQLSSYYGKNVMNQIENKIVEDEEFFDSEEWEEVVEDIIS